jgi:hypothetical protein
MLRPRFQLRSLFILISLTAVGLGVWQTLLRPYRSQAEAFALLAKLKPEIETRAGGPEWLHGIAGADKFQDVVMVKLEHHKLQDADLAPLARLPQLERLYLAGTPLTDKGMAHLAPLHKLQRLSLWGTKITDEGLKHLRECRDLEVLDIHDTRLTKGCLVHLQEMPHLRELHFDFPVDDVALRQLAAHRELQSARYLDCHGVSDVGIRLLAARSLAGLRYLRIEKSLMTSRGLALLAAAPDLTDLRLKDVPLDDEAIDVWLRLPKPPDLVVQGTHVTPEKILTSLGPRVGVCGIGPNGLSVDAATLDASWSGKWGPQPLAQLAHLTSVRRLDINSGFPAEAYESLPALESLEDLTCGGPVSGSGLQNLARCKNLRLLSLTLADYVSVEQMQVLRSLEHLEILSIYRGDLADEHLAFLQFLPNLQRFVLHRQPMTGDGLRNLAHLSHLDSLNLTGCWQLSDSSLSHVRKLKSLTHICLQETSISDAGLELLHGMPNLREVSLSGSRATIAGSEKLKATLKNPISVY